MGGRIFLWLFWFVLVSGDADPAILHGSDLANFQQSRTSLDPRPRLSVSQQAQILSDVQQHQQRYVRPQSSPVPKQQASYSSLAKYKVDRSKQQQIQQLVDQQQHLQQLIQRQQQKLSQQLNPNFLGQSPQLQQFQQQQHSNEFLNVSPGGALYNDQQLQEYLEKQRELESLQKQRQQLLLEQQEVRRQQELLRLQQLQRLTSTTQRPVPVTSTVATSHVPVSSVSVTTSSPLLVSLPTARKITPSETELFLKAIATHQKKFSATTPVHVTTALSTVATPTLVKTSTAQSQDVKPTKPQIKIIYQTERPGTENRIRPDKDALLKQLKLALAQSEDDEVKNLTTRDIVLPNGRKVQLIDRPGDLALEPSTTIRPPKAILDELTKGVLPPGADFEVIRQKSDGKLEEVGKVGNIQNLPGKKVTFVVLEEQPDGSYKVQGVKGNAEKENGDVDSIVEKIKKGELKLPPSSGSTLTSTKVTPVRSSSRAPDHVTPAPNSVSTTDKYLSSASSVTSHVFNSLNTTPKISQVNKYTTRSHFIPTMAPVSEIITTSIPTTPTTYSHPSTSSYIHFSSRPEENLTTGRTSLSSTRSVPSSQDENVIHQESFESFTTTYPTATYPTATISNKVQESLTSLLKREGLFAMAKYLRQSGLDNVLNETGPYTIFVPTDKAFRTLLVQLGGPEKAEQKFKDNPRLLSGLLLHHVIPGAFRIGSLQDDMTGVSLAGTQLRVNEYSMHDHEWNDIKVTTINGARVAPNKRDIEIPQGIAHAVDRVMFPLPVGDLVQTLQADRERRFTTFLKLLYVSGFLDTLSGPKTFTVFAPTDSAFEAAVSKDGQPIWSEEDGPEAAKTIVSRHILPSSLYTAGMRYYLQKDTLRPQSPVHIHKNAGRVKINDVNVITHNVPATNGVLHAIDGVL